MVPVFFCLSKFLPQNIFPKWVGDMKMCALKSVYSVKATDAIPSRV